MASYSRDILAEILRPGLMPRASHSGSCALTSTPTRPSPKRLAPMESLFKVNCSVELAKALGAKPMQRLDRPNLSFPVFDLPRTHHACLETENGPYAWLWLLDGAHRTIQRS